MDTPRYCQPYPSCIWKIRLYCTFFDQSLNIFKVHDSFSNSLNQKNQHKAGFLEFGAGDEDRTHDILVGNEMLYRWATPAKQRLISTDIIANPGLKHKLTNGIPEGVRTPVTAVKGRCPRPLDDGDTTFFVRTARIIWIPPATVNLILHVFEK